MDEMTRAGHDLRDDIESTIDIDAAWVEHLARQATTPPAPESSPTRWGSRSSPDTGRGNFNTVLFMSTVVGTTGSSIGGFVGRLGATLRPGTQCDVGRRS